MRADDEGPDAFASGRTSTRAIASLVACLVALNAPAEPVIDVQAAVVPQPALRPIRPRLSLTSYPLATPALALLLVVVATPSLAWREPGIWPPPPYISDR